MPRTCSSARRCSSISCPGCAWRYSLRVSRRIQAAQPRRLYALTITYSFPGPAEFGRRRKSIHNLLAYRRGQSRWWQSLGLWLWQDEDRLSGFVEFGSINSEEFVAAFRRHGVVCLRPIKITEVRVEVYKVVRLIAPVEMEKQKGRYQPFKIAIEPVMMRKRFTPATDDIMVEPLPIIC